MKYEWVDFAPVTIATWLRLRWSYVLYWFAGDKGRWVRVYREMTTQQIGWHRKTDEEMAQTEKFLEMLRGCSDWYPERDAN